MLGIESFTTDRAGYVFLELNGVVAVRASNDDVYDLVVTSCRWTRRG